MSDFNILTIKAELIATGTPEEKNETWNNLRIWENKIFRLANFFVDEIRETEHIEKMLKTINIKDGKSIEKCEKEVSDLYKKLKKEGVDKEDIKEQITNKKQEISEIRERNKGFFKNMTGLSKEGFSYQMARKDGMFDEIPGGVTSCVQQLVSKKLKDIKFDLKQGKVLYPFYKKGMPIPFSKNAIKILCEDDDYNITFLSTNKFKVRLKKGAFGIEKEKYDSNIDTFQRIISGELEYGQPSLQVKGKRVFLIMPVKFSAKKVELNPDLTVGVDIGMKVPLYAALSEGYKRISIGSIESIFRRKSSFERARRNIQMQSKYNKGGKGRQKKIKAIEKMSKAESAYINHVTHKFSKEVIDFALKHGAGVIKMELLSGIKEGAKNTKALRNFVYFQLQSKIEYKAKLYGIKVLYVDPYLTSQTCAVCGHYEEGQRIMKDRDGFYCKNPECKNYNKKVFSDYNAALNIAKSEKYVTDKSQCEVYKLKSEAVEG